VARRIPERAFAEQWQSDELAADVKRVLNLDLPIVEWAAEEGMDETGIRERLIEAAEKAAAEKAERTGADLTNFIEKSILLQVLDQVWKEHLLALDHLRQGIGLRAYGQRDPLNEYKREAFALFNALLEDLKERVTQLLSHVAIGAQPAPSPAPAMTENHPAPQQLVGADAAPTTRAALPVGLVQPFREDQVDPERPETWASTPRNAPCPCGSGKKFKYCHGKV
jgi:preprotein translocase subunit SecA